MFERDGYECFYDEWELGWRRPMPDGLYFDLFHHTLRELPDIESLKAHHWPDPVAPERFAGTVEEVQRIVEQGKAVVIGGLCAGIWEMSLWLRGYDQFLLDMAVDPDLADWLIGHMADLKLAYWEQVLGLVGEHVSVCYEADDLAAQDALIVSPGMYRRLVKPHQRRLFAGIKRFAPHAKLVYHTDGAVKELIPDLIEIGVDAINPVQVSAAGMDDTAALNREFGRDLCFWGAGCDSQNTLPHGTPEQVREEVKRRLGDLAPGGGYVFAGVHNIQADVPPENLDAMWTTFLQEAGY
jgi:uroporphyrinogen decarboxylase